MTFCVPIQRGNDTNNFACNNLWTRNIGVVYDPPPPSVPFLFVCLYIPLVNVLCINLACQHMFGIARRVQLRHKRGASKMDRLLFTLTVLVMMTAPGG